MMITDLKNYIYDPESGHPPRQIVILLHGLGADGQDLIGLAPYFAKALPDAVFVAPDAPFPCDMAPYGYQWFSLQNRDPEAMLSGVEKAEPILDNFITGQIEKFEVPPEKTALIGFSQGTMMSLYVAPRYLAKLGGVLGYSGALIGGDTLAGDDIHKIPVHLVHGDADDVVPVSAYHHARTALEAAGFPASGGVSAGLGHGIDPSGIESGAAFLKDILD